MNQDPEHEADESPEDHEPIDHDEGNEEDGEDDDSGVSFQRKDGTWEKLERKPLSGDPEVEAMGKLRWEDLQAIVEDPSHPQHEQAVTYSRLLGERMRKSIAPLMGDVSKQYESLLRDISKSFKMPTIKLPRFDVPKMPGLRDYNFVPPKLPESPAPEHATPDDNDEDEPVEAIDPVLELVEGVTKTNSLLADQNRLLRRQASNSAIDSGVQTVRASQEARRANRALAAAWAAVGVTVAVGIVQIWQNAGG